MTMKKISKSVKKRVEIMKEAQSVVTCLFKLDQIVMKKDYVWRIKMFIKETLKKTFHSYGVKLIFNDEPYLTNIEDLESEVKRIKTSQRLFPDIKGLKKARKEVEEATYELRDLRGKCPVIEFDGTVEELKYKEEDTETMITLRLSAEKVNELNELRLMLGYYKIELTQL